MIRRTCLWSLLLWICDVMGHGRLLEPPSRASMWRFGFDNPPNYDDNQLFCGGVHVSCETTCASPIIAFVK